MEAFMKGQPFDLIRKVASAIDYMGEQQRNRG